jgi:hypothetical protein
MRSRVPAIVFGGWLIFCWATRIRNAFGDDDLSAGGKAWAVTVATAFTLGGVAVLFAALRRWHLAAVVRVVAGVTIVYWPVRVVQIALADHDAGFVVVHAVLGVVSVALAVWAWSALGARRPKQARARVAA